MGLGSTARKIQKLSDTAEELYKKLGEILERIRGIEESIEDSRERVAAVEARLERQEALIEAIAREHDLDPAEVAPPMAELEADEADETTEE